MKLFRRRCRHRLCYIPADKTLMEVQGMKEKERTSCPVETSPAKKAGGTCCGGSHGARLAIVVILLLAGFTVLGYTGVFDGLLKKSSAEGAKAAGGGGEGGGGWIALHGPDPGEG